MSDRAIRSLLKGKEITCYILVNEENDNTIDFIYNLDGDRVEKTIIKRLDNKKTIENKIISIDEAIKEIKMYY